MISDVPVEKGRRRQMAHWSIRPSCFFVPRVQFTLTDVKRKRWKSYGNINDNGKSDGFYYLKHFNCQKSYKKCFTKTRQSVQTVRKP